MRDLLELSPPTVAVSACLLGRACRYDGGTRPSAAAAALAAEFGRRGAAVVAVCPEELGGLGTPRPAAALAGGDGAAVLAGRARVLRDADGGDVTAAFVNGAARALAALRAEAPGPGLALLKARSPSCGVGVVPSDGALKPGDGVFAAALRAEGYEVISDEAFAASTAAPPVVTVPPAATRAARRRRRSPPGAG